MYWLDQDLVSLQRWQWLLKEKDFFLQAFSPPDRWGKRTTPP